MAEQTMTIEEVLNRTPNGLHDAYLLNISVDYRECVLRINLNWWVGVKSEIEEVQEAYREGTLIISGLQYFVAESPANGSSMDQPSDIDGFVTRASDVMRVSLPDLSSGASRYSIFVGKWNSFIHFAGTSAEVTPAELIVREMVA
jgi:hypothetical protein